MRRLSSTPQTDVVGDAPDESQSRQRSSLASVVGRLAGVNAVIVFFGLVTGPLQARALGPEGRGLLAAIMLPLTLAPVIVSLGLGVYVVRETARGKNPAVLLGSVGTLLLGLGLATAAAAPLVADLFADGRDVIYTWVLIGLVLTPLSLMGWLLVNFASGLERWREVLISRCIPAVINLVGVVVLYAAGKLTVGAAAALSIAGGLLAIVPLLPMLRDIGRPKFRRAVAAASIPFGLKAWVGGLGSIANVRLDQLLMVRLVQPQELGLYVVALTISGFFVNPAVGALSSGMLPRFSTATADQITRVLRITMVGVAAVGACVAIATPLLVRVLFGADFADAIPMALVLLVATVPLTGVQVLSTAMTSSGHPGFSAVSEFATIALTVPLLLYVLPRYAALGAAVVSVVTYTFNYTLLLFGAKRHLGATWGDLLLVRRADLQRVADIAASRLPQRVRARLKRDA